jgi:hypothetical protein
VRDVQAIQNLKDHVINEKRITGCTYLSLGSDSYVNHSV